MIGNKGFGVVDGGAGGGGGTIVPVTTAELLALAGNYDTSVTYKVTDIQQGLFIRAVTAELLNANATLEMYAPNYTTHAQYYSGSVANNEIVTWGGYYWQNTSGGSVTPDVPNEVEIDSDSGKFTRLEKNDANGYELVLCYVVVNTSTLAILEFTDNNGNFVNNRVISFFGLSYENTMINQPAIWGNEGWCITNCYTANNGRVTQNKSVSTPAIRRCNLDDKVISNNEGVGTMDTTYIENCSGIVGVHLHLSYYKNISITGGSTVDENELNNESYSENISITGNANFVASGYLDSSSFDKNITITGDGNEFNTREFMGDSGLDGFTITANNFLLRNIRLENTAILSNFSTSTDGRQIVDFHVSSKSIDLTGFDRDIIGERIQAGKGWFAITHDFATSPLTSGNSVYYNLLPTGCRLTSIQAIGASLTGGAGARLAFGMETDAAGYIGATVLATINSTGAAATGFSAAATGNRSLQIAASVADVTGGTVTVLVEFVV